MTGRYSLRSGLSLVAVEGTLISLPAREITMAEMLHDAAECGRPISRRPLTHRNASCGY
jgi:hypothetical protein